MLQTKDDLGNYLVDAKGMTLYYFEMDSPGKSNATEAILQNWPIFSPESFNVVSTLKSADFGVITRDDGKMQATYKGRPLYYFAGDRISGDTDGQGVNGLWCVINPDKFAPESQGQMGPQPQNPAPSMVRESI